MDARTHIRTLPFELGFLALLTSRRIKPLSRWEDALSAPQMDALALANAPNPFSSSTKIMVNLPGKRIVTISIFDVSGRKVRDLFSGEVEAGRNAFDWDGRGSSGETLPSGVYFCALRIDSALFSSKMLKLR